MKIGFAPTAMAFLLALASPALPQTAKITDKGSFAVTIRGLTAATLSFSGVEQDGRYAVHGVLQSAGLVSMVRNVSYEARSRGTVSGQTYRPSSYTETSDNGKRVSTSRVTYKGGVPSQVTYEPARELATGRIDPATMGGTVDTLTALYATLRDVDKGQECKSSVKMFDGRQSSLLRLSKPQKRGEQVICSGEYRRLKGFSAKKLAEKTSFPFTLTYSPTANGRMQVTEVATDTTYGQASLKRR